MEKKNNLNIVQYVPQPTPLTAEWQRQGNFEQYSIHIDNKIPSNPISFDKKLHIFHFLRDFFINKWKIFVKKVENFQIAISHM